MNNERNASSHESPDEQVIRLKAELEEINNQLARLHRNEGKPLALKALLLKSQIEELENQNPPKE
jgi:hypothetical protein